MDRTATERGGVELGIEAITWALCVDVVLVVCVTRLGVRWSMMYGGGVLLSLALLHLTYVPRSIAPFVEAMLVGDGLDAGGATRA